MQNIPSTIFGNLGFLIELESSEVPNTCTRAIGWPRVAETKIDRTKHTLNTLGK